ncbi:guanine nucleotide binding protein, alpha subunit [Entophlyctis helioformis]|nr:guanine nucleotide binding protein, alpha subunit [Entophlyctis helioformis]
MSNRSLEARISREIDRQIEKDRIARRLIEQQPLVLLLGASDSGKTTLLKNFRILYTAGFTAEERAAFKRILMDNILDSVKMVLMTCAASGSEMGGAANEAAQRVLAYHRNVQESELPREVMDDIKAVWSDSAVQAAVPLASDLQDTAIEFIDNIELYSNSGYSLTNDDILRVRFRTSDISETSITLNKDMHTSARFVDVSGIKFDRKHWLPYFDNANTIIFVVSLSSFDQMLVEDPSINRMTDALELFDHICNHPLLDKVDTIVFLNKKDLFKKKLKTRKIADYFPVYKGENDYKEGIKFFQKVFVKLNRSTSRDIIVHATTCTDQRSIKIVLASIITNITKQNIINAGISN